MDTKLPSIKAPLLLVNDDGVRSPFVLPFIQEIKQSSFISKLSFAFPAEEQSWISKSLTRFKPVYARKCSLLGIDGLVVCGTPADCVGVALSKFVTKPDYIFSGINLGENTGLGYFLSSGTIGAALEGALGGVKALCFSVDLAQNIFEIWHKGQVDQIISLKNHWVRLAKVSVMIAGRIIQGDLCQNADIVSVNLPWEADENTEMVITQLADTRFINQFIEEREGCFRLNTEIIRRRANERSKSVDRDVIYENKISVCPISFTSWLNSFNY